MMLDWQHPELKEGEVYIGYCTEDEFKQLFKEQYPGSRWGLVPYSVDGKPLRCPVDYLRGFTMPKNLYEEQFRSKLEAVKRSQRK